MSLYLPSGTNLARLQHKLEYMDMFQDYINLLKKSVNNLIIAGDYNICHRAIDIHDPIRNKNISGFLPVEREWLQNFIDSGFTAAAIFAGRVQGVVVHIIKNSLSVFCI